MKRLLMRLERLEAKARPADPDFTDFIDYSKLTEDEIRRLVVISDICIQQGESAVSSQQITDMLELFNKAAREGTTFISGF
jgi:hypothetical protein